MSQTQDLAAAYQRRAEREADRFKGASDTGYGDKFQEIAALFSIAASLRAACDTDRSSEADDPR